ncbi:MAG TPA: MBL fold metallo-hydrolase [Pyrinomonadaceae bacterium]|jgi:glyoxylase-like metal-dependent hydrolase (beta-lactamase superfamily II)|nr:MBL fold metallo-hydrolase [Pyrinomonadaceae bacterium]
MRTSKTAFRLGLFIALVASCALGQTRELTTSEQSYREARRVLDAGLAAYGGLDALRTIENFTIRHEGHTVHRHQSRRTDPPYERTPLSGTLIVDARRGRFYHDNKGSYPGGFNWHWGLMTNGKDSARVTFLERRINSTQAIPPQVLRGRLRWLPHNLLISAHERSVQLRSLGRANFEKRPHDVLTYSTEEGVQLTIYLDARTHLVSKFELLTGDPYFGDSVQEIIFPAYRAVGQFQVPTARVTRLMGEVVEEIPFVEVAFNKTYGDEQFKAPAGFAAPPTAAPIETPPVNRLAENVYMIRGGGYNVLAVGFKDHVMVVETPGGDQTSREVIARVKELMPGKPIKYAAVTHHHDDHAGGVRTYIAEGATIITTPGLRSFFERVAAARNFTFNPDTLTRSPRPLSLETLQNGKRVFTDGEQTVELYDIGSGPHMDEMIVAYLPKEKIIFQGDLLNRPEDGHIAPGNATTAHFADWLKKSGLAVERIVGVHGPVSSLDDLHKSVALMQSQN